MEVSGKGLKLIKVSEGLRLAPYLCPANVPTIGYGATGHNITLKMSPITESEASVLLLDELAWVYKIIRSRIRVELSQGQFDALCSLIFNIGSGNFISSTLRSKLNRGDYYGASMEFWKWRRGGGKILPGLVARRECERLLFVT